MKVAIPVLSKYFLFFAEFLALLALYKSDANSFFWVPVALLGVLVFTHKRIKDSWLFAILLLEFLLTSVLYFNSSFSIVSLLTRMVPLVHATLWFAEKANLYRYWRLGIALLEMILAATIAPEAYMFVAIFFFVIAAALALSLFFLETKLTQYKHRFLEQKIPGKFLLFYSLLALLVFLSSLVIFPLLPRSGDSLFSPGSDIQYTEQANMSSWASFFGDGSRKTVMRLYFPETLEQSPVMLLRGKSLERFVNGRWIPGQRHLRTETTQVEKEEPYGKVEQESMQTDTVFAPYGVRVAYDPDTFLPAPRRTGAGDWFIPGTLTKRKSYLWFPLKEERTGLPEPLPDKRLLEIPKLAQENRWRTTAERSFRSTKTTIEKVRRVQELLGRHEGVLFTEAPTIPSNEDALSHFFFTVKKGHCELFASSSAILLRMAGVPTRLVAGFRSVQNPGYRGLRLVKNTEAHVWVEYWDGQWKPFDPTPIILAPTSAFDFIEDSFDFVSRFWYRNIVSYEFTFGLWREYQGKLPWILGVLLAIKALFWFWRRKPKEQWQESKQRKQLSKLMDAIERLPQGEKKQTLQQEYEALRFGRVEPTAKDRKKLQEKIQAFS